MAPNRTDIELQARMLDALEAHVAVLDPDGTIIGTNAAWRRFARQNRGDPEAVGVGSNYLEACDVAVGPDAEMAQAVAAAIRAVLTEEREPFYAEYPCHSPETARWFSVRISRFGVDGSAHAVVAHDDITERKLAEQELQQREAMQEALLRAIPDSVLLVGADGCVSDARLRPGASFFGGGDAVRGRRIQDLVPNPYGAVIMEHVERAQASGETQRWDHATGHGEDTVALEMRFIPSDRRDVLVMIRDVGRERRLEMEVLEASAREQRRIGRDIHDGLGQELAGLSYIARSLAQRLERDAEPRAPIADRLHRGLEDAIGHASALAYGLNPVDLEREGLLHALRELVRRTEEVYGISCQFAHSGTIGVTDPSTAYHLFRIAQEAIHNATKHARTPAIEVALRQDAEGLVLTVRDEGRGFDPSDDGAGMGLHTMRYRARLLGATLHLDAAPGAGTDVVCRLPRAPGEAGPSSSSLTPMTDQA